MIEIPLMKFGFFVTTRKKHTHTPLNKVKWIILSLSVSRDQMKNFN